jgi:hypothetical protein
MEYATNEGRDWRSALQQWLEQTLKCTVFNPNSESDRFLRRELPNGDFRLLKSNNLPRYTTIVSQLVDLDSDEIAHRSDFVICYWDASASRGAGTKGELTIAKYFDKPVYMVTSIPPDEIPGWVLGCTTKVFSSFDELKTFLRESLFPNLSSKR